MATAAQLTYLQSNNPDRHGVSVRVVDAYSSATNGIVSANYILFPGDNVSSDSQDVPNSFINKTVTLGSSDLVQLSRVAGATTLNLFVDMSATLCNYDYYVVVSLLYADGTSSPFQTSPVLIPLTPSAVTNLVAVLTRNYPSNTVIQAVFDAQECVGLGDSIIYNAAVQWMDGSGNWNFLTQEVTYSPTIGGGGVEIMLPSNDVDEAYLALQAIRIVDGDNDTRAIGALGETVLVTDSEMPDAPINFAGVYEYSAVPPTVNMTWNAAPSSTLVDVTHFNVYLSVNGGPATSIATVPYNTLGEQYSYDAEVPVGEGGYTVGDVLVFYVTAVNPTGESGPSASLTINIVEPSSPPLNLTATGLREILTPSEASLELLFQNPAEVSGGTYGAYFVINVFDSATDVRLATRTVPYDADMESYQEAFNNVTWVAEYSVEVYLVTTDEDDLIPGGEIIGRSATVTLSVNYAPLVTNVNGVPLSDRWNFTNPLTSFDVYTFQVLTHPGTMLTLFNGLSADQSISVLRQDPVSGPTPVDDPYGAFDGAYKYHYEVATDPYNPEAVFIQISASNASGLTTVHIIDQIHAALA